MYGLKISVVVTLDTTFKMHIFRIFAKKSVLLRRRYSISQLWYCTNQEVYVGSLRLEIIILSLLFLLETSNIRNHPEIAKFIFILSWIYATMHLTKFF